MRFRHIVGLSLTAAVVVSLAPAQDQAPEPRVAAAPDAESDSIRAVSASFVKAYNAKDARALGALFIDGAEVEDDDGTITQGRAAITARFADRFKEVGEGRLETDIESIRFLGPTLAVETGTATIKDGAGSPESNHYSVLYVKQDGRWLQARIKDESPEPETASEHLKELDWLIGEWVNESDDAIVSTTCNWSDDGSFLLRQFDIKVEGAVTLKGTQRIGWDAVLKQYRTWVFDSEGGYAEGLISQDEHRWVAKLLGSRADGQLVSATNIITRMSPDRMAWEISDRTLDGKAVAGTDKFFVVRKPPEPGR